MEVIPPGDPEGQTVTEQVKTKPKVFKPGQRIQWTQYQQAGAGWTPAETRAGTVWSGAPIEAGVTNAWWVVPDAPDPGDCYHAVYVGRARSKSYLYSEGPREGEVYSSRNVQDVTSIMTVAAWRHAQDVKAARQAAAAEPAPPFALAA